MHTMHPFMAAELPSFDLATALRQGLVPLVTMTADPADTLAAYAGLYLEQEVKAEGLTRNVSREDFGWRGNCRFSRAGRSGRRCRMPSSISSTRVCCAPGVRAAHWIDPRRLMARHWCERRVT